MEYRKFELKGDINQLEYVTFRNLIEEHKPAKWENILDLPIELFYYVMVIAAAEANWVEDVIEKNQYEEETTWSWKENGTDYVNNFKAGNWPWKQWGGEVFNRWSEIRSIDPN